MFIIAPILAQLTGPVTAKDIEASVSAISAFEAAADRDLTTAMPSALNVCRLELSESLRGLNVTATGVDEYHGKGAGMLAFACNGYLQGAFDILSKNKVTPLSK